MPSGSFRFQCGSLAVCIPLVCFPHRPHTIGAGASPLASPADLRLRGGPRCKEDWLEQASEHVPVTSCAGQRVPQSTLRTSPHLLGAPFSLESHPLAKGPWSPWVGPKPSQGSRTNHSKHRKRRSVKQHPGLRRPRPTPRNEAFSPMRHMVLGWEAALVQA